MAEFNTELVGRIEKLSKRKEQLVTEKEILEKQLNELKANISKQGFDPEKLTEEIDKLSKSINEFETKALPIVEKIESELNIVNNNQHAASSFDTF